MDGDCLAAHQHRHARRAAILLAAIGREDQEQPQGVSIGLNRVRTDPALADEAIGEERLQGRDRKNSVRTRNARLAAIRSLFRYAALRHPEHAAIIERVLAIPPKRFERRLVTWLTEAEIEACWLRQTGPPGRGGAT